MAKDYSRSSMTRLIRDCISARDSRKGYIEHPATKEIFRRLPNDLRPWFAKIMYEIGDPSTGAGKGIATTRKPTLTTCRRLTATTAAMAPGRALPVPEVGREILISFRDSRNSARPPVARYGAFL